MTFKEIELLAKALPGKKHTHAQTHTLQMIYQQLLPDVLGTSLADHFGKKRKVACLRPSERLP